MGKHQLQDLRKYFACKQEELERLCIRCGACCGAYDGDPCVHLIKEKNLKYRCGIYKRRLGIRKTVSGEEFECVPIWEIVNDRWPGDKMCAYKKAIKKGL